MQTHSSILLATALGVAACGDTSILTSVREGSAPGPKLVVHIVEADGGG